MTDYIFRTEKKVSMSSSCVDEKAFELMHSRSVELQTSGEMVFPHKGVI